VNGGIPEMGDPGQYGDDQTDTQTRSPPGDSRDPEELHIGSGTEMSAHDVVSTGDTAVGH